ncbi:MAG: DUF4097 family beta strand repeat protein [Colwellia sp.]|nr:DUF4097 family beta strand repeat protein [Colwellia sp.]
MRFFHSLITMVFIGIALPSIAGESINQTLAIDGVANVRIENLRGQITLSASEFNEITVKGELDVDAERFIFEREGSHINIKVLMPRHLAQGRNKRGSNLVITIPKQMKVNFVGVSTNVLLNGFSRSVEVKTVSGNIKASHLSTLVELTSVSGNINSRDLSGKIRLSTVSGNINDKNSTGRLNFKAVSGNVVTRSNAEEITVNTVSGDVETELSGVDELFVSTISGNYHGNMVLNDNGSIKMSSISGNLNLIFDKPVQAKFKMNTKAGGRLINKLTADNAIKAKYGARAKLNFSTGNGSGSVKATTVSGQIKVAGK